MADKHFRITTAFFIFANLKFGDVTPEMIVQSNGNFTLQPNVQGTLEEILWKRNHHKVVEFDQMEVVEYGQFKGRTTLDLTTGALTLTHLTEADSGEYVGELQIKRKLVYHRQTVKVFDAVGKPAVTCQVNGPSVTLLCYGGDRPSTQYRWEGPAIEPQPGSQLKIEAAESSDAVYTCVLHNPVGESRTDLPVKSCFPAPGSASVIISVVLVLLLIFIIVGLLLFYYKKCYKRRQNEEDMEAQSGEKTRLRERDSEAAVNGELQKSVIHSGLRVAERQQLLPADPENVEETPVKVWDRVKLIERGKSPEKTHDEHQKTALTEQHKGTDGSAGISQEESQTESLNQGEDSEERGVETEGGNSKHPSSGTVPFSAPESPPAAPPKTENEEETIHPPESSPSPPHPPNSPPHPAPAPVQNQDQEEETGSGPDTDGGAAHKAPDGSAGISQEENKTGGAGADAADYGDWVSSAKLVAGWFISGKTHDQRQKTALTEQHKGTDGSAGISQEESQTESLNQGEDSEERGVETEGGNSKHPSSGTVPFSAPVTPPAAPSKTGNEEKKTNPPDPAQELLSSPEEEEDILESQTGSATADVNLYGDWPDTGKTCDEHQKTALTEQHKGTDGSAGVSQEESQTESLNQGEDSEERGVETEGGNPKHPSSGTVPFSTTESPPAAPPKTENEEETFHSPPSSPSPLHLPKSSPAPAPAPVQSQDQEAETGKAAAAESTDETAANQTAGAQREREKREGQDGGSDGGGAQSSGAGGGGDQSVPKPDSDQDIDPTSAEENLSVPLTEPLSTADPAQGLPDTTARSPPHTGASEGSCCAEESPTSGPNLEPNSTSEAEEEKKRGREERKDSQDRGVKSPPVKPPKPPKPLKNPLIPYSP